jgi:hypothetical protein
MGVREGEPDEEEEDEDEEDTWLEPGDAGEGANASGWR